MLRIVGREGIIVKFSFFFFLSLANGRAVIYEHLIPATVEPGFHTLELLLGGYWPNMQ
jgi:hypothetical protein